MSKSRELISIIVTVSKPCLVVTAYSVIVACLKPLKHANFEHVVSSKLVLGLIN